MSTDPFTATGKKDAKYDQIREGTFLQTLCRSINNHEKTQSNAESAYPLLATKHGRKARIWWALVCYSDYIQICLFVTIYEGCWLVWCLAELST